MRVFLELALLVAFIGSLIIFLREKYLAFKQDYTETKAKLDKNYTEIKAKLDKSLKLKNSLSKHLRVQHGIQDTESFFEE